MKIISKYKDYYDYLQGIYGMDEKLILECYIPPKRKNRDYSKSIWLQGKQFGWLYGGDWYYTSLVKDVDNINEKEHCPILVKSWSSGKFIRYPILKDFNLPSYISAEKMYNMLSEWLSNQITKREQISEISDVLKIESKGFDKKRSFRPNMK